MIRTFVIRVKLNLPGKNGSSNIYWNKTQMKPHSSENLPATWNPITTFSWIIKEKMFYYEVFKFFLYLLTVMKTFSLAQAKLELFEHLIQILDGSRCWNHQKKPRSSFAYLCEDFEEAVAVVEMLNDQMVFTVNNLEHDMRLVDDHKQA